MSSYAESLGDAEETRAPVLRLLTGEAEPKPWETANGPELRLLSDDADLADELPSTAKGVTESSGVTLLDLGRYEGHAVAIVDLVELVEQARGGDGDAWEVLYRRIYPKLLSYARRRLDAAAAADAVAEAMVRAVERIDRFVWQGGGFDAWMFGILRHVVLDVQRSRARRPRRDPTPAMLPSPDPDPLECVLGDEEAMTMRAAFERLSPSDRELLELRVVAGLSAQEAGDLLGKRPGAIRMAQARALQRLRELLEEDPQ